MAAPLLASTASLSHFLETTLLHSTFFPHPLLACIHAARVSLAAHAISAKAHKTHRLTHADSEAQAGWLQNVVAYLIVAWGGAFWVNYLVHQTPPQLLSPTPLVLYLSVYAASTLALQHLPLPSDALLDTALPLFDGATRTLGVVGGIALAKATAPTSLVLAIALGTLGASAGGQTAATINAFSPAGWSLSTPPLLRAQSLVEAADVLAPLLATCSHLLLAGDDSHYPILGQARAILNNSSPKPLLTAEGAKASVTLIISAAFALRAIVLHWTPAADSVVKTKDFKASHAVAGSTNPVITLPSGNRSSVKNAR